MPTLAHFLHRNLLWLLLGVYAVAWLAPGPGEAAARLDLASGISWGGAARLPIVLVALLLFLASSSVELADLRGVLRRPGALVAALLAGWVGPTLVLLAAGVVSRWAPGWVRPEMLVGVTLVAAMPVANSAAGWAQQSGGALAWALGLVVASILACPLVTPVLLGLLGMSLSPGQAARLEEVVLNFSGVLFVVWVVLPTAAGLAFRRLVGAPRADAYKPVFRIVTTAVILALNYVNGALALPKLGATSGLTAAAGAAAVAICFSLVGVFLAGVVTRLFGLGPEVRQALRYALSMKHTGLALGLAATVLTGAQQAILFIVVATPVQHLVAGLIDRYGAPQPEQDPST